MDCLLVLKDSFKSENIAVNLRLLQRPNRLVDRLKIRSVFAFRNFTNILIRLLQILLFKANKQPLKILVFRTGSIGDSICAMPAMSALRTYFPNTVIHLLTNAGKGRRNLVSIEALIEPGIFDSIINYESLTRQELSRRLKVEKYDLVIHLTQYNAPFMRIVRDMAYFRFVAGIRSGFGWQHSRVLFFRQTQEKYLRYENERDRLNNVLLKNGVRMQQYDLFPFNIDSADRLEVEERLSVLSLTDRPSIAIVAGAKRPQNRWPIAYFDAVIRHFCDDYDIYLTGGPEDAALTQPLLKLPNVYSFCGVLTPVQSGLLMQRCSLVLTNDTGPMHLAYGFGVPVVALFSNRDFPGRWYPPDDGQNIVLRSVNISCSLCLSETCGDNICMQKITPEVVIEKMNALLARLAKSVLAN